MAIEIPWWAVTFSQSRFSSGRTRHSRPCYQKAIRNRDEQSFYWRPTESGGKLNRGEELFAAACGRDLEGIVAKWKHGNYVSGPGTSWIKIKSL